MGGLPAGGRSMPMQNATMAAAAAAVRYGAPSAEAVRMAAAAAANLGNLPPQGRR